MNSRLKRELAGLIRQMESKLAPLAEKRALRMQKERLQKEDDRDHFLAVKAKQHEAQQLAKEVQGLRNDLEHTFANSLVQTVENELEDKKL